MKTFEAVVLIADGVPDGQNESISMDNVTFGDVVRVSDQFKLGAQPLGRAKLRRDGNNLIANIELFADFDPSGRYPAIGGMCKQVDKSVDGPVIVRDLRITEIALSKEPNTDPRIPIIP